MRQFEDRVFIGFVIVVSLAMAWIVAPFYGAVLWALVAAIVFGPMNHRLMLRTPKRRTSVARLTLVSIVAVVMIPAGVIASLLVDEALEIGRASCRDRV